MIKMSQPIFPIESGIKSSKNERREKKNMRHCFTWVGIICCVSVLFAVEVGATVPFADDLPDIRLIRQGAGAPTTLTPAFDLDDYVIDNDDADDELSWSRSVQAGGPVVNIDDSSTQPALHDVDVLAQAAAGVWNVVYTVSAPDSQTDTTQSKKKYSSFWLTEPKFTADNRLSFKGAGKPRFTHVMLFDGSGSAQSTPSLLSYISPSQPFTGTSMISFGPLIAHSLGTGTPVEVARGNTINVYGGLGAQILTPSGVVALTPTGALSCAVLLSIPAVLQGSSFSDAGDWDGTVIMVAPAKEIERFPAATIFTDPTLAQNTGFEDIPAGAALQPGGAGTSTGGTFITGAWRIDALAGTAMPTFSLITAAQLAGTANVGNPANQFAGATSGNVLKIAMNNASGSTDMVGTVTGFNIRPVQPGEVYGVSMNVSTDIPSSQVANYATKVKFVLIAQTKPDLGLFTQSALLFAGAPLSGVDQAISLPVDGKWRQLYTEFIIPELNYDEGLMDLGCFTWFRAVAAAGTPAFNVYIDNVYFYCKGMSDMNYFDSNGEPGGLAEDGLANGVTAFTAYNPINPGTNGAIIDGSFETGTTLASNNWVFDANVRPGAVNVPSPSGTAGLATTGRLSSSGSAYAQIPSGTPRTAGQNDGLRFRDRGIAVNGLDSTGAGIAGAPDLSGEGYYGVSFWIASDATNLAANPEAKVTLLETRPTLNQIGGFVTVGPSCIPTSADGWYQYAYVGAFPDMVSGKDAMQRGQVIVDVMARYSRSVLADASFPPEYQGNNRPGYNANARIYFDDIRVHKVNDSTAYWNASLFD